MFRRGYAQNGARRQFHGKEDVVVVADDPPEIGLWKGFPLALATSGIRPEVLVVLEILGFSGLFDPVITSDDVPRAKPAPDCYLSAARQLGKEPSSCVVVEDSAHGIQAAVAAGMRVLVVSPDAASSAPAGAERVFPSTVDALRWLRG